jgi:hypothetical protein
MIDGKFYLEILDQKREMLASFGFIEMVEQSVIKKPIVQLLDDALIGRFSIYEMVTVFYCALKANKDTRLTRDQIGEEVAKRGAVHFVKAYIELLTFSLTGATEIKNSDPSDDKKK